MKKVTFFLLTTLIAVLLLTSCRPPELEGAFVDFNAKRYDNALKLARQATAKYPSNAEAWFLLGRIYGQKEMIADMHQAYKQSLALSNQFEKQIKQDEHYYYGTSFNNGVNKYNAFTKIEDRKSEKAQSVIKAAIKNFKNAKLLNNDFRANNLLALCYNVSGQPDSALTYYNELIKINPDTAVVWINLGQYYFIQKDYKKSIENLRKALEIDSKNVEAITLISQAYDMVEDTDNAIKAYEQAKAINPEEKAFPYNLGLIYSKLANKEGVPDAKKKEYLSKVAENFDLVIKLDPEIKVPYQMKSFAELQLEQYDAALVTLKQAIEHFPEEGSLYFNLGVAYSHLGNKKEAKKAFAKAEELGYK